MEIFCGTIRSTWSKLEHLVQNGPTRKNEYFQNLITGIVIMCPRKNGTCFFQIFIAVILVPQVKFTKTSQ